MTEIVSRLRAANRLTGSRLFEADDDEKYYDEDDGPTPIDDEEPSEDEDMPEDEELEDPDDDSMNPSISHHSPSSSRGGDDPGEAEEPAEEQSEPAPAPAPKSNNPLDNTFAISFEMGDTVCLASTEGNASEMKGTIEGYDKNGFYRIQWEDGSTTSGITDTALIKLAQDVKESKCICGSKKFVNENNLIVCDNCGRKKQKGKIYSPPHNVSTAIKPNISETIKNSLKSRLKEEETPKKDSPTTMYMSIHKLQGEFWSTIDGILDSIKKLGYEITYYDEDMIEIHADEEEADLMIPITGTARTKMLDFKNAKLLR